MSHQLHPTDEITAPSSEEYAANATSDPGSREEAAAPPFGQALVPEVILSEGSHPLPPERIVAALDDDNDDGGTNAKRIVAGTSPASKSNDDVCGDVPIPLAQMAVGLEATEEGRDMMIMEKKKKHAGAAAASGGNRTVLDDGPAAPAHSPSSGSVDVERRGSGSEAAAPPSGTAPATLRREPSSVRVIEATLVEDKPAPPVYDAILVAGPSGSGDDANDPLRWKRHKFAIAFAVVAVLLFGALTAAVAAMLASNNSGGGDGNGNGNENSNSNSNADANTEESVGESGSLSTIPAPSTSHATNHPSLRPALYKSTSVPSRPTTLSPTTVAPTLLPVVPPTASPSTSVTFSIVRECNQILEVSAPREFDDIEVGIYQILLQRYTANFGDMVGTPFVVTNCTVTEQTWVGGRRVVQREGSSGHGLQGDDSARERRLGRNLGKFEGFGEDVRKTPQNEEKRSHLQSSKWLRHNPKTDLQAEILEHMVPSPPSSRTLQTTTPRILLVVQFNIHYESRYGVVIDDYPSLFQEYINSNLEEVTLDMQAVFLPVVLAREVIVYNTKQPTLAPSPGGSGRSILPTPAVPPPTPQGGSLLPFASLVPNVAQSTAPITSFAPVPTDQPTRIVSSTPSPSTNSTFELGSTYIPTATSVRSCNYRYNWSCSHSEGKTTLFHTFIFSLDTSAGSYPAVANFYWDENSNDPGDFLMLSGTYGAGEEAVLEGSHVYDQEGGYYTRFALYFGMGAGGCGGNLYEQGGIFFAGPSCSYSDTLTDLTFVSYCKFTLASTIFHLLLLIIFHCDSVFVKRFCTVYYVDGRVHVTLGFTLLLCLSLLLSSHICILGPLHRSIPFPAVTKSHLHQLRLRRQPPLPRNPNFLPNYHLPIPSSCPIQQGFDATCPLHTLSKSEQTTISCVRSYTLFRNNTLTDPPGYPQCNPQPNIQPSAPINMPIVLPNKTLSNTPSLCDFILTDVRSSSLQMEPSDRTRIHSFDHRLANDLALVVVLGLVLFWYYTEEGLEPLYLSRK